MPKPASALAPNLPTSAVKTKIIATFKTGLSAAGRDTFKISRKTSVSRGMVDLRNRTAQWPKPILFIIRPAVAVAIITDESAAPGTPRAGTPKAPKMKIAVKGTCTNDAIIMSRDGYAMSPAPRKIALIVEDSHKNTPPTKRIKQYFVAASSTAPSPPKSAKVNFPKIRNRIKNTEAIAAPR